MKQQASRTRSLLALAILSAALPAGAQQGQPTQQGLPSGSALPPLLAIQPLGTQAGYGETLVLGPGARLELGAAVQASAVRVLDGQQVGAEAWNGNWSPGAHQATVLLPAADGSSQLLPPLEFLYDPSPPTLQWEVGTVALLDGHGLDQDVERRRPPRHTAPEADRRVPLLWSPDGRRWLPMLPRNATPDERGALADWLVASDRPQVFVWALEEGAFAPGAPIAPGKLGMVRLWAADEISAVRELRLRLLPTTDGGYQLEMVAVDLVGNTTTVTWPLA